VPYSDRSARQTGIRATRFQGDVGRWPANVALDEDAAALLDEQSGIRKSGANPTRRGIGQVPPHLRFVRW
jgi:hypothetical protein